MFTMQRKAIMLWFRKRRLHTNVDNLLAENGDNLIAETGELLIPE